MIKNLAFRKKLFNSIIYLCLLGLIITFITSKNNYSNGFYSDLFINKFTNESENSVLNSCKLPLNIDPFDKSVAVFLDKLPKHIICKNKLNQQLAFLTYINSNNTLVMNSSDSIKCFYQFFNRLKNSDEIIVYKKYSQLNPKYGIAMADNEFVNVSCFRNKKMIYKNSHYVIPKMKNVVNLEDKDEFKPSVVILVIESMSRINFIRYMNYTKHELERLGNIHYLKGLTIIAENSYPNMIPFLTGKRWEGVQELNFDRYGPKDDFPLIWKKYKSKGYTTAFIEDAVGTLFNYISDGFVKHKPTDFYPRPYWLHMYNNFKYERYTNFCLNNTIPVADIFLDQVKSFVNYNKIEPTFTYAFLIEVTHDDFNNAQLIDEHFAQFIRTMNERLKDVVFILMGDHGNRYGDILETEIGRIESRMPLFAIRLPETLHSNYPHLRQYLDDNSEKLVSWLDIHQLLLDIVENNYKPHRNGDKYFRDNVYSPWRQLIPSNRTCSEALISDSYCMCLQRKPIKTSDNLVKNATKALINHMNSILPLDLCEKLTLNSTIKAMEIIDNQRNEQLLEITIIVNPSSAELRAQLYRKLDTSIWLIRDGINRINKYGNQSYCVRNVDLKLFCYCKKKLQ